LLLTTGWSIEGLPSPFMTHKFTNAKTGDPTYYQRHLWHQMVKRLAPLAPAFFARHRPDARAAHEKGYGPYIVKSDPTHTRRFPPDNAGVRPSPTVILGVAQRGKKAQTWITHIKHLRFDPQPLAKGCSLNEPPAAASHQSRSVLA
jgi:hypothetical protein